MGGRKIKSADFIFRPHEHSIRRMPSDRNFDRISLVPVRRTGLQSLVWRIIKFWLTPALCHFHPPRLKHQIHIKLKYNFVFQQKKLKMTSFIQSINILTFKNFVEHTISQTGGADTPSFADLPSYILLDLFHGLNGYQLSQLFITDKQLRNRIQADTTLNNFYKKSIKDFSKIREWLASLGKTYTPKQLSNLTGLFLSNTELTQVPPEIGQLNQLRELFLYNNRLTQVPPEIGQLKQLQYLYLYNNRLTQLPQEIGHLNQLRELDLSDNGLTQVPPEIGQLKQLLRLYLNNTGLTQVQQDLIKSWLPTTTKIRY